MKMMKSIVLVLLCAALLFLFITASSRQGAGDIRPAPRRIEVPAPEVQE